MPAQTFRDHDPETCEIESVLSYCPTPLRVPDFSFSKVKRGDLAGTWRIHTNPCRESRIRLWPQPRQSVILWRACYEAITRPTPVCSAHRDNSFSDVCVQGSIVWKTLDLSRMTKRLLVAGLDFPDSTCPSCLSLRTSFSSVLAFRSTVQRQFGSFQSIRGKQTCLQRQRQ